MNSGIIGLSKKELEIVSWLEFYQKHFFNLDDVNKFFRSKSQKYNSIKNLLKKKRIIKLARRKYYLIPIKAKSGSWVENPFIMADEIFDGKDYFIGCFAAANYWKLTDQIPAQIDIYTTKRQGKKTLLNTRFIFHRTTKKNIARKAIKASIGKHEFKILSKKEAKEWLKSKK